jgi:23S rRNA (uridine2552-2'-O)-methyltransferase
MTFKPKDRFYNQAKEDGYKARSVYKLEEIDRKLKLLKPGQKVIDLGCAPGSWSQFALKRVGAEGGVLGIDLKEVDVKASNAHFFVGDIYLWMQDETFKHKLQEIWGVSQCDLVLSDMAPSTTGIRSVDQDRSLALCETALQVALLHLKPKGHFVCKLFHSDQFQSLKALILKHFDSFQAVKPEATRAISKEIFLVGLGRKVKS